MSDPTGLTYWRSLEQLADAPEVRAKLADEFDGYDPAAIASLPRRRFMKLMAASMALAGIGVGGCRRWPREYIVPAVTGERAAAPGELEKYATAYELAGVARPLLVTCSDGRPIKIEGNNEHPATRTFDGRTGCSDAWAQASVLDLYDPDRSKTVLKRTPAGKAYEGAAANESTWDDFYAAWDSAGLGDGAGVVVVSELCSGLTFAALKERFQQKYPAAQWVTFEPTVPADATRAVLSLDAADVVFALDADLLGTHPNKLTHARDFGVARRRLDEGRMNRLYVAEAGFSLTGVNADNRLPTRATKIPAVLALLASTLGVAGAAAPPEGDLDPKARAFVGAAAEDLKRAGKAGVVVVGDHLPAAAKALARQINQALGAEGTTVRYVAAPAAPDAPARLMEVMNGAKVVLVLGGNPAYAMPAFGDALSKVELAAHLATHDDETSRRCGWHLPQSHYLEAWGDARSYDGTVSVQQPMILPLHDSRSALELLAHLVGDETTSDQTGLAGEKLVRTATTSPYNGDETAWKKALKTGMFAAAQPTAAPTDGGFADLPWPAPAGDGLELRFVASQQVHDGRFANNGWLQEVPDPTTKLVWDNALLLNKEDADQLGVGQHDKVSVTTSAGKIDLPAYILWGQPKGVATVALGYGRPFAGRVGHDVGVDVNPIRPADAPWAVAGATFAKAGGEYELVSTQDFAQLDKIGMRMTGVRVGQPGQNGRVIREASFDEYVANPRFVTKGTHALPVLQLYDAPYKTAPKHPGAPEAFAEPHAWGMSIDMTACVGCNACVVACQAENNVPIVGKPMVQMNREMHWLRLDRYFKAKINPETQTPEDYENVDVVHQPLMCVHCETAPCEQVCPVAATVHDTEGLNTMVYNRCIGTRYCSNNCPYKVRRFNYFDWHARDPRGGRLNSIWLKIPDQQQLEAVDQVKRMQFNPDVTVRMRGVMEKCTFCTQRIKLATIHRKNEWSKGQRDKYTVGDLDVVVACQEACPTQAIVFGDLNDPTSRVWKGHQNPRAYSLLEELNTRPRTRHLGKVRNPAPGVVGPFYGGADTAAASDQKAAETHGGADH